MEKIIEFKNNNFKYPNKVGFDNFNLEIYENDIITLIGPASSGKTTLIKMICHQLKNDCIMYRGKPIGVYDSAILKRNVVTVIDEELTEINIRSELAKYLKALKFPIPEIDRRVEDFIVFFNLKNYEHCNYKDLPFTKKNLLKIIRYLIINPRFIAIDCLFSSLELIDKKKIIKYIKVNNIALLNITNNLDEALFSNRMCVMDNFSIILEGKTTSILKMDTILKRLGFKLPLSVELSLGLGDYNIIKKVYLNKEKLVRELWK